MFALESLCIDACHKNLIKHYEWVKYLKNCFVYMKLTSLKRLYRAKSLGKIGIVLVVCEIADSEARVWGKGSVLAVWQMFKAAFSLEEIQYTFAGKIQEGQWACSRFSGPAAWMSVLVKVMQCPAPSVYSQLINLAIVPILIGQESVFLLQGRVCTWKLSSVCVPVKTDSGLRLPGASSALSGY